MYVVFLQDVKNHDSANYSKIAWLSSSFVCIPLFYLVTIFPQFTEHYLSHLVMYICVLHLRKLAVFAYYEMCNLSEISTCNVFMLPLTVISNFIEQLLFAAVSRSSSILHLHFGTMRMTSLLQLHLF